MQKQTSRHPACVKSREESEKVCSGCCYLTNLYIQHWRIIRLLLNKVFEKIRAYSTHFCQWCSMAGIVGVSLCGAEILKNMEIKQKYQWNAKHAKISVTHNELISSYLCTCVVNKSFYSNPHRWRNITVLLNVMMFTDSLRFFFFD